MERKYNAEDMLVCATVCSTIVSTVGALNRARDEGTEEGSVYVMRENLGAALQVYEQRVPEEVRGMIEGCGLINPSTIRSEYLKSNGSSKVNRSYQDSTDVESDEEGEPGSVFDFA